MMGERRSHRARAGSTQAAKEAEPKAWWWQAVALRASGVPMAAIALACGKSESRLKAVLASGWGRTQRRELAARVAEQRLAEAVDPIVKFQAKGARMADIMLQAAEDEAQPLKKALIAEKNLALGGWVAVQKSMTLTVEATIRDRDAVPDDVLEAFANGGALPDALKPLLLPGESVPAPADAADE
jgi:hypothetical protein